MGGGSAELDYAREVYADAHHSDLDESVALAQMVQRASIAWAGRPSPR